MALKPERAEVYDAEEPAVERRRRRNALYPCMGVAASVLVGLHATVDFTMQVPAVAATYALIMGAACSQSWSTRNGNDA